MSALIVIDDGTNPPTVGSVDEPNSFLGTLFTFTNFDDSGVLGWRWTLVDKPEGSSAVLSSLSANTTTITPDIAGSYLVRLETFLDAARTQADSADEQLIGVRYPTPRDWLIPAAGQTLQLGGVRGWAAQVNRILIDMQNAFTSSGLQANFDVDRNIVTTAAKGPLTLDATEDTELLILTNAVAGHSKPILKIVGPATGALAPTIDITSATANQPVIKVRTGHHKPDIIYLDDNTNLTKIIHGVSGAGSEVVLTSAGLLFGQDAPAIVSCSTITSGDGQQLTIQGGFTSDGAARGGPLILQGGQGFLPGNTYIDGGTDGVTSFGDVNIGTLTTVNTFIGDGSGNGICEVQNPMRVDFDFSVGGSFAQNGLSCPLVEINSASFTWDPSVAQLELVDTTAGNINITLPLTPTQGALLMVKKTNTGANKITLVRAGTETIEGAGANFDLPGSTGAGRPAWVVAYDVNNNAWWLVSLS